MKLPLVDRELRSLGRRPLTYVLRAFMPVVFLMVAGEAWFNASASSRGVLEPQYAAGLLIVSVFVYQWLIILLALPFLASGVLSVERSEKTLELLTLADFRGIDVVMSKLAGVTLHAFLLLAGALPLYAFAAFLGGVDFVRLAASFGVLIALALAICASGVYFSLRAASHRAAIIEIYFFTVALLAALTFFDFITFEFFSWTTPVSPVVASGQLLFEMIDPRAAGVSIGLTAALGLLFIVMAVRAISRGSDTPAQYVVPPALRGGMIGHRAASHAVLTRAAGYPAPAEPIRYRVLVALLLLCLQSLPGIGWAVLLSFVSLQTLWFLHSLVRDGVLDDLRLANIGEKTAARLLLAVYAGKIWVAVPALVAVLVSYSFLIDWMALRGAVAWTGVALMMPALFAQLLFAALAGLTAAALGGPLSRQHGRLVVWVLGALTAGAAPLMGILLWHNRLTNLLQSGPPLGAPEPLLHTLLLAYDVYLFALFAGLSWMLYRLLCEALDLRASGAPPRRPRVIEPGGGRYRKYSTRARRWPIPWSFRSQNVN